MNKQTTWIAAVLFAVALAGMGCASMPPQTKQPAAAKPAAVAAPKLPEEEVLFKRGWEYYRQGSTAYSATENFQKAIETWNQVVELDPFYLISNKSSVTFLVKYEGNDFPIWFYLGAAYYDIGVRQPGEEAKQSSYLKAIECFDEALSRNLPQREAILNYKAECYRKLGDTENVVTTLWELVNATSNKEIVDNGMAQIAKLDPVFARQELEARILAEYKGMVYVSASGSDDNDGLTEETAFKTLNHAFSWSTGLEFKNNYAVIVIGTLNQSSEGKDDEDDVFSISTFLGGSYLITGIPYAPSGRKAILSAAGTNKTAVYVLGGLSDITFRFEHIEISGSKARGLAISIRAELTLGDGAVVRDNTGGGVLVYVVKDEYKANTAPGHLIIDGGIVENNKITGDSDTNGYGGGVNVGGKLTMKRGAVRNNTAIDARGSGGGGIYFWDGYTSVISGGEISGNTALVGGGICIGKGTTVTMTGGTVSGNTAVGSGVAFAVGAVFNQNGGKVSDNKAPSGYNNIQVYRLTE
jgi:hypothetical protein